MVGGLLAESTIGQMVGGLNRNSMGQMIHFPFYPSLTRIADRLPTLGGMAWEQTMMTLWGNVKQSKWSNGDFQPEHWSYI